MPFKPTPLPRGQRAKFIEKRTTREEFLAYAHLPRSLRRIADENAVLKSDSRTDPLTGLFNRRVLEGKLKSTINAFKKNKNRTNARCPAILFLDINSFKALNDSYGHSKGDILLKKIAATLKGNVRQLDTVARIGGDEMVILLDDITPNRTISSTLLGFTNKDQVKAAIVERYKTLVAQVSADLDNGTSVSCPVSIGIKLIDEKDTPISAIEAADAAMYADKKAMHAETGHDRGSAEGLIIRNNNAVELLQQIS